MIENVVKYNGYPFEGLSGGLINEEVTDNKTLDAQDVGKAMIVTATGKTITLPAAAAGLTFVVVNGGGGLGLLEVSIDPNGSETIIGQDINGGAGALLTNTLATAMPGDFVVLVAGAGGYHIVGSRGTWTKAA